MGTGTGMGIDKGLDLTSAVVDAFGMVVVWSKIDWLDCKNVLPTAIPCPFSSPSSSLVINVVVVLAVLLDVREDGCRDGCSR
jgi:hypothetical protein